MAKSAKRPPTPAKAARRSRASLARIWITVVVLPVVIAAAAIYGIFRSSNAAPPAPQPTPDHPALIDHVESLYNDISVYKRYDGDLMLLFGAQRLHYIESIINPNDPLELPVTYTQSMAAGALAYPTELKSAMIIGLGGGRTSVYLHKSVPDLDFTAVELDPDVVQLGAKYFGVHPETNFAVEINDGRVHLARTDKQYDAILIDAYRGPFVPFHLLTTEFYKLVAAHLKPGGVAVQNVEPTTMLFDSAVATISAAFQHLVFLKGEDNIVIVAYNGPEKDEATLQKQAADRQAQYHFRYDLPTLLQNRFTPAWDHSAKALTDDFAPVEFLKAVERHNAKQQP
ncbi:MAG TPA: fused MFS/spermidine synthase [Bauldia sp.]|nr:fused MFS/spermidine synthase [Bauldia sp.]